MSTFLNWLKSTGAKILAVVTPILGLLAYIFVLRQENEKLEDSIAVQKAKDELGKVLDEKQQATEQATAATDDYQSVRDAYLRADATNLPAGNSGSGQGASGEGQGNSAG